MKPVLLFMLVPGCMALGWLVICRWINAIIEGGEARMKSSKILALYLNFIDS